MCVKTTLQEQQQQQQLRIFSDVSRCLRGFLALAALFERPEGQKIFKELKHIPSHVGLALGLSWALLGLSWAVLILTCAILSPLRPVEA